MRRIVDTVLSSLRMVAVPTPDAALLIAFVERGDRDALELLIRRHSDAIWRTCLRVTSSVHDAEDAFQATCYILATKARSIRNKQSLAAWLQRVAVRAALAARERSRGGPELTIEPSFTPRSAEATEELRLLEEEVARLPDRYRIPLVLCHLDGKSNAEAAALLGIPEGTIYSRLARGRDRLRDRLVRRGLTPSVAAATLQAALAASEAASAALLQQAVQVATSDASAVASASSIALAKGVLHAMWWNQCRRVAMIVVLAGCVSLAGWRWSTWSAAQAPAPAPSQPRVPKVDLSALHQARIDAATKAYENVEKQLLDGKLSDTNLVYQWSLRLLEAQRDASSQNERAALAAHRDRMRKMHELAEAKYKVGTVGPPYYYTFVFAVAEADLWIEQAKLLAAERKKNPTP